MRKNILLVNDDGIEAAGIRLLAKALSAVADVYVCAPHKERSASGHGLTMGGATITFTAEPFEGAVLAYSVTGTPADCVKLGLGLLEEDQGIPIDFVFSGINNGPNLGTDTLYSGTVSAALEGAICGKYGCAVSLGRKMKHTDYVCELAVKMIDELARLRSQEQSPMVLNLNVPDLPREEIKGIRVTRLGYRGYEDFRVPADSKKGNAFFYKGTPVNYDSRNLSIDVLADQEGYVSITPLDCDLTNVAALSTLAHLEENKPEQDDTGAIDPRPSGGDRG